MTMIHHTFVVERTYPKPPQRVFEAFRDAAQKQRWSAEGPAHDLTAFDLDFRPGGKETTQMVFKPGTPIAGMTIVNTSWFLDIETDARVIMAQHMTLNGITMSAALVTFELAATEGGTTVTCTHQGTFAEHSDGPERREGGWNDLMDKLGAVLA